MPDFAWFTELESPWGTTWWSSRHLTFVTLHFEAPNVLVNPPGPRMIARSDSGDWTALQHVMGPTVGELLARHTMLPALIAEHVVERLFGLRDHFTRGVRLPELHELRLGYDGALVLELEPAGPALGPTARPAIESALREFARLLGVTGYADVQNPESVGDALRALDPEGASQLDELLSKARALPPREEAPPGPFTDAIVVEAARAQAQRERFARNASAVFNELIECGRDWHPSSNTHFVDVTRDFPEKVAQLQSLRERALLEWPELDLFTYPSVRQVRARYWRARGGRPTPSDLLMKGERAIESLLAQRLFLGSRHPPAASVALDVDIDELQALGLFALVVWRRAIAETVPRAQHSAKAREHFARWRDLWSTVDDEIGSRGIDETAGAPPRFGELDKAAVERAATREEERAPIAPLPVGERLFSRLSVLGSDVANEHTPLQLVLERTPTLGGLEHAMVFVRDGATIGAHHACEVHYQGVNVARRHARFHREGGAVVVEPLSTSFPTLVDGRAIDARTSVDPHALVEVSDLRVRAKVIVEA